MITVDRNHRSPNYGPRHGHQISMLVLHATVGTARSALAWLTNPAARVSAHLLIDKRGTIYELVPDEFTAWHAGRAFWQGETAINEVSIGIELENANDGRDPYPAAQLDALLHIAREKVAQYHIAPDMVVRHLDVAVPRGRKTDPAGFPWNEFRSQLFPNLTPPSADRPPRPAVPRGTARALALALRSEAFRQVGAADQAGWAMARFAQAHSLGLPTGPSFDLDLAGQRYAVQSFGRDTLLSPIGDWQRIERLSGLIAPEQHHLREALLTAVYAQADEIYHPDWAFHQYAQRTPIGPPLTPSFRVKVDDHEYVAACYALDVIFSPVESWRNIGRLSDLLLRPALDHRQKRLAELLQERLFERVGSRVRPDWPMYQYALREQLGAPLGPSFRVSVGATGYAAEAYALDVVYCELGKWRAVGRLSQLATE